MEGGNCSFEPSSKKGNSLRERHRGERGKLKKSFSLTSQWGWTDHAEVGGKKGRGRGSLLLLPIPGGKRGKKREEY